MNININLISDYVEELKKLLFSLPKTTLKATYDRYSSKAPETLTSQFPDRARKAEAVKSYKERQKISTKLFPAGKINPLVYYIYKNIKDELFYNQYFLLFVHVSTYM